MAVPERLTPALILLKTLVVVDHQLPRGPVGYFPQAHDVTLRTGQHEGPTQTVDALTVLHFIQSGVTRRQHHQLGAPQVQRRQLGRGEYPIFGAPLRR